MPLFRKHSHLDNTAAIPASLPPQETTVNHNYAPSRALDILAWFVVIVIGAVLLWHGLVFLAGQADYPQPERAVVNCLMGLGIILALLAGLGLASRYFLADYYAHRERMEEKKVELERTRMQTAQLIPPATQARMTREESRKYLAVKVVMARAYQRIDAAGKLLGKVEPWSRREVGRLTLLNEGGLIGENSTLASWVKPYLLERKVLLNDRQVNLADFPTLAAVETQLVKNFGPPILYRSDDEGGMSTHYLERGTDRESWG